MSVYERTDIYDLLEDENKYSAVKKHWATILEGKQIHSLLDVSIGTGNMTLPLAELDVKLYGSDLSKEMLEKCAIKAKNRALEIDLRKSDFRELNLNFKETFDCVASTGNSLPHVTNEEITAVLEQMDAHIRKGGYLYYDMRNWDKILREKNRFYLYNPVFKNDIRINLTQVWDYNPDSSMTFHLLYTFEKENVIIQKEQFDELYFPVRQEILIHRLKQLGYKNIQILCHPAYFADADLDRVDWYCVIAQKPSC